MQFSSMIVLASAAAMALFSAQPAAAADYRVLVNFPKGQTAEGLCARWNANCQYYVPTDSSLKFGTSYCQPGDFQGKNNDTTAKVFCTYKNSSQTKNVVSHVASYSQATLA